MAFVYNESESSNSDKLKFYLDGTELPNETTGFALTSLNTVTASFNIGAPITPSLTGKLDGVAIFDYALSSSQVTTLYGSSSTGIGNPMSLSPKPVAYYPLGDQDAFNGADYLVPNSSLKDYVFDFTASFDEYINLGNNSVLQPASNYTFSIWFNADSYSYKTIFGSNTSTSSGVLALPISNNTMTYYHATSTTTKQFNISLTDAPINNWHNFTVTWSASTGIIRAFINGKFKAELTGVNDINWGNELLIGKYYQTYPFLFEGKLSNFAMWNTTLTDGFSGTPTTGDVAGGQVAEVYNNGSPQTTITGTPVGWWKLDASDTYNSSTGNWTIEDSSSNSNDGTSSGMTQANLVQSDLSFTSGYSPYALDFDGTDDYINLGTTPIVTGIFTFSLWIKRTSTSSGAASQVIIGKDGQSSNRVFNVFMSLSGVIGFWVSQTGSYVSTYRVNTSTLINDTNWHNLIVINNGDNNNNQVFIDGTEASYTLQGTGRTTLYNTTGIATSIGSSVNAPTTYAFNGKLSNASIWNTALTSAQVTEIYSEGVPQDLNNHSAYSNLVSWWQLGSNTSWVDPYWIALDEKGTNNGQSQNVAAPNNMGENAIVDGVGSYANGLSSGMGGDEVIGDAPYSTANSLSVNMDVLDRVTDTPS